MRYLYTAIPAISLAFSAAGAADDLKALDRVGQAIAVLPCAKPTVSASERPNPHTAAVMDRHVEQVCSSSKSRLVRTAQTQYKRTYPVSATVSGSDSRVPTAFQVGTEIDKVKARLGKPAQATEGSFSYLLPSDTLAERVTFVHDGNRVVRIEWEWYVD